MARVIAAALAALVVAGCGGGRALEGALAWQKPPTNFTRPGSSTHAIAGVLRNKSSHDVALDVRSMRLLDDNGRKVKGRIQVRRALLSPGQVTPLVATWTAGKPVRIDYGAGTLALPSS